MYAVDSVDMIGYNAKKFMEGAPEKEWSAIGNDADEMLEESGTEEFHIDVTSYNGQREPQEER
eukprot:786771-Heterocapsa_arctica.AAC.1